MKLNKNKIFNIIIYLTLIITISITIFTKEITNLDELWNFSYAKNIADGLIPYKDFNLIVTPLYAYINGIILNIFGKHLYIYRISNMIFFLSLTFILTKILNKLNITQQKKQFFLLIYIPILAIITYNDYNFFNSILLSLIIYIEIKDNNKNKTTNNLIIGIICSLMILTKQTTGVIITFVSLLLPILEYLFFQEKNFSKIKNRLIGTIIILASFLIYLISTNNLSNFIDLTILGLKDFNSRNFTPLFFILIGIILYIGLISYKTIYLEKDRQKINLILILYSIFSLTLNYPILDTPHFIISILPLTILIIYNFSIKIKAYSKIIIISLIIALTIRNYQNLNTFIKKESLPNIEVYKYLKTEPNIKNTTIDCIKYINNQEEKVYILAHDAVYYMLALNQYHHYFDLPLAGNIGTKGEKEMIKTLEKENIILLINNRKMIQKDFKELDRYIQLNYLIKNNVTGYNIYKKISNK